MKANKLILFITLFSGTAVMGQHSKSWHTDPDWILSKYDAWGGPGVSSAPGPMDTVLLKDYAPRSSVISQTTFIPKARFAAIDAHTHVVARNENEITEWVKTMDEVGIQTSVILTNAIGKEFELLATLYLKQHPGRFILYCGMDTTNAGSRDYPERVVAELARCYKIGARGVGEWTDKGLGFTTDSTLDPEKRLHPNDPRLYGFWEKCAALKMPVSFHISDHPSNWTPLDVYQERTPDYQHFNKYKKDGLSYEDLLAVRDQTIQQHPKTIFLVCHLANEGNDLTRLGKLLDTYPNMYLDISARDYEVGRTPRAGLKFLTKYSKRVLFGTDMGREKRMYRAWWRLLESDDEFIVGRMWWRYYGLKLPETVLKDLYRDNALRMLHIKNSY